MRAFVFVILVAGMFAGCIDGEDAQTKGSDVASGAGSGDDVADTDPSDPPVLDLVVDAWGENVSELIVFDGQVRAQIGSDRTCRLSPALSPPPCWPLVPAAGPGVPFGTARLRVEADAGSSHRAGSWYAFMVSPQRPTPNDGFGEGTTQSVHTWEFDVAPGEWGAPWWSRPQTHIGFTSKDDGVLDGPIDVVVTAVRDPEWVPYAQQDHFRLPAAHRVPQEGAITLLDTNATVRDAPAGGRSDYTVAPFTDLIPYGTASVVIGVQWSSFDGCAIAADCFLRVDGRWGRLRVAPWDGPVDDAGPDHFIRVFQVPDIFESDHDHLEATLVSFEMYPICRRSDAEMGLGCFMGAAADYHIVAEAWKGPVDLAAFKGRLGVD